MQNKFLSKEKISIQTTKFAEILAQSNGYTNFDEKIMEAKIEYDARKYMK